jgi:hypothetical protein
VQRTSQQQLWLRILGVYPPHILRTPYFASARVARRLTHCRGNAQPVPGFFSSRNTKPDPATVSILNRGTRSASLRRIDMICESIVCGALAFRPDNNSALLTGAPGRQARVEKTILSVLLNRASSITCSGSISLFSLRLGRSLLSRVALESALGKHAWRHGGWDRRFPERGPRFAGKSLTPVRAMPHYTLRRA